MYPAVKRVKNGFLHDISRKYLDAEQSEAKKFEGMFLHEIMMIKTIKYQNYTQNGNKIGHFQKK